MDRATEYESDFFEEDRCSHEAYRTKKRWKKRRVFSRKNRKPSKPNTYIGQRSNNRPRG